MLHDTLVSAIQTEFAASIAAMPNFEGSPLSVPVCYDNQKFDQPESSPWIRFSIQEGEAQPASFGGVGNRRVRKTGVAFAQIHIPVGEGSGRADFIARKIESDFTRVTKSNVHYRVVKVKTGLRSGEWWMVTVEMPWWADRFQ